MTNGNQCQGCQANWPIEVRGTLIFRLVQGGYPGEKVMCTADAYRETDHEERN